MIVFLSDIAWDGLRQRPQHLASRFARTCSVLWVEPATLGHRYFHTPAEAERGVYRMTLPMFPLNARNRLIGRIARLLSGVSVLRRMLAAIQRRLLRRAILRVHPGDDDVVFFVENFQLMHLVDTVSGTRVLYDYIDDAFGFVDFPGHVRRDWESALRRADVVTATSPMLETRIRESCDRNVVIVRNGVEYERFADPLNRTRPEDLPPAGDPIAGYIGSVYPWIDFDLLARTAEAMPDVQFVIVGQQHPDVRLRLQQLSRIHNVRILGVRPYSEVPRYLAHFHAGIIPFRKNLLTEGVNPVKMYEYSAAGVPTVATDFSPDTRTFAELVLIARSGEEFVDHIRTAITRRIDPVFTAALRKFARGNDWDSRANVLSSLLFQSP